MEESTKERLTARRAYLQEQITKVESEISTTKRNEFGGGLRIMTETQVAYSRASGIRIRRLNQQRYALGKESGAIGRLLAKASMHGAILSEKSFATQLDYVGGGAVKVRAPKEEKKGGKMKASQRRQQQVARGF